MRYSVIRLPSGYDLRIRIKQAEVKTCHATVSVAVRVLVCTSGWSVGNAKGRSLCECGTPDVGKVEKHHVWFVECHTLLYAPIWSPL